MEAFGAGCVSGFFQIIVGHPLDTLKIWAQGDTAGTWKLRDLYRGLKWPLYSNIFLNGVLFGSNHVAGWYFDNQCVTGAISGVATALVVTPMEQYKILDQCSLSPGGRAGLGQLFRGLHTTLVRETFGISIYFGSYDYLYRQAGINSFWAGGVAGVLSWALVHPVDTVKTRIQMGQAQTVAEALRLGKVWSGLGYTCARAFIVNSVGFYVYQTCMDSIAGGEKGKGDNKL